MSYRHSQMMTNMANKMENIYDQLANLQADVEKNRGKVTAEIKLPGSVHLLATSCAASLGKPPT